MDSWARVGVGEGDDLFVSQEDVKDFFYRLGIGQDLGEFFSLPPIDPRMLQDELGYLPVEAAKLLDEGFHEIYPYMCVLPMGFSWAFHLAHEAHAELGRRTLPRVTQIRDREPAPLMGRGGLDEASLIYADNHNHLGTDREKVDRAQRDMIAALHDKGLDTHDVIEGTTLCESLGVRIDGSLGSVQVSAARDHRLDQALLACSARPALSGEELQVIVGHMTMRSLLNRGLLSILRHVYVFIQKNYLVRRRLWPSVLREIEIFRNLMVLGAADLRAGWDPRIYCTDACPSGYAVLERYLGDSWSREVGKEDERWRYHRCESQPPPRAAALGDILEDVRTVRPDVEGESERAWALDEHFPEVPRWVLDAGDWKLLWRAGFEHKDGIHVLEARSILGAVKHVCRDSRRHGTHVVVLNDNMGTVLASQKGRCAHFGLLRVLRRIAAHSLSCGIRCHVRWVPSELNVADYDSRWRERGEPRDTKHDRGHSGGQNKEEGGGAHEARGQQGEQALQKPAFARVRGENETREKPITSEGGGIGKCRLHGLAEAAKRPSSEDGAGPKAAEEVWGKSSGTSWRAVPPRDPQRDGANKEGLRCEGGRLYGVREVLHGPDQEGHRARRSLVRLRRAPFPEWGNLQLRAEAAGGPRVRATRDGSRRVAAPSSLQTGTEGVAKVIPSSVPLADAGVLEKCDQWSCSVPGSKRHGALQRADVLHVRPAGRGSQNEGRGFRGETARAGRVQVLGHRAGTDRKGRGQQSGHLRRGVGVGRHTGALARGADVDTRSSEAARRRGCGHVEVHSGAVPRNVEAGCGRLGHRGCRPEPLPEQTRGGQPRPPAATPQRPSHSEAGSLGCGLECEDLRQAREIAADGEQAQQEMVGPGREDPVELSGFLPQWYHAASSRSSGCSEECRDKKFLSLFGGVGECAKVFASKGGAAAVIDISYGTCNDLSKFSAWNKIRKAAHLFSLIGIDLPCNTWTRARRAPPWSSLPGPLRGDHSSSVLGRPDLKPRDKLKVQAANRMMYGACTLIRLCLQQNIPGYVENPLSSRLWLAPPVKELLKLDHVHFIKTHMCMHGTQWKKPTGILVWCCKPFTLPRCSGKGKCSRTGKSHIQLTGIRGSRFATERAQIYPRAFAASLVNALC